MKVNILFRDNDTLQDDYKNVSINNLNTTIDDGEVEEFFVDHIISFLPAEHLEDFFNLVRKKLKAGGTLTIVNDDIYEITKAYITGIINSKELSQLISQKSTFTSLRDIMDILKNMNMKILYARLTIMEFSIKAQK